MDKINLIFLLILLPLSTYDVHLIAADLDDKVFDERARIIHRDIALGVSVVDKTNISTSCKNSLHSYFRDLESYKPWAVQIWDSIASRRNAFFWPGNFDECLNIQHFEWKPQYCLTEFKVNDQNNEIEKIFHLSTITKIGICLPSSCMPYEVIRFVDAFVTPDATVTTTSCQSATPQHLDAGAIAIIIILSIFVLLFTMGTLLEIIPQFNVTETNDGSGLTKKNLCRLSLTSFSGLSNARPLFITDHTEGSIECLHGLRFLSMTWVILIHVFTRIMNLNNCSDLLGFNKNFFAQIILNGTFSVDTFFCISGLLVSYSFFRKMMKTKKFNIVEYYLHRYIRLTPVYAIAIGIAAGLFPYIGSGPKLGYMIQESERCKQNWWLNLIYASNLIKTTTMCQIHCWYLAADMQLYILAPIILYPLYRNKYAGAGIAAIVVVICIIADALITYVYDLPATGILCQTNIEHGQKVYVLPYTRAGPYVAGLITGYVFSIVKKPPTFFNKKIAILGWLAAALCNLSVLFGLYNFQVSDGSLVVRCFYSALSRTGWAIGIVWIVFACKWGYGGPINAILSWRMFVPLSKLTYSAYILHSNVLKMFHAYGQITIHFDAWTIVHLYFGIMVSSYMLAIPFTLLFELPILKLEKLIATDESKQPLVNDDQETKSAYKSITQ